MTQPISDHQWEELKDLSIQALKDYFVGEDDSPTALQRAKMANVALGNYTRYQATESSREQTRLILGRQLSENPEQFRSFAALNLPKIPLPEPKAE